MRAEEVVGLVIVGLVVFSIAASFVAPKLAPAELPEGLREIAESLGWAMENFTFTGAAGSRTVEIPVDQAANLILKVGAGEVSIESSGQGESVVVNVEGTGINIQGAVVNVGAGEVRVLLPEGFSFDSLTIDLGMGNLEGVIPLSGAGVATVDLGMGNADLALIPQGEDGTVSVSVQMGGIDVHGVQPVMQTENEFTGVLGSGEGFRLTINVGMGDALVRVAKP